MGVVPGRGPGHQLLATLQAGRQAGAVAAVEQGRDQAQGVNRLGVLGAAEAGDVEAVEQAGQLGLEVERGAPLARLGQLQWRLGRRHGAGGNTAEITLGQGLDLLRLDIADHHQSGIVRHVPGAVPGAEVIDMHALEVGHPADGRVAVAAGRVGQCLEALIGQRGRLVVGAQAALFLDDLDLAGEFVGRQFQAGQTVGFELQGHSHAVAGQHLVVSGVVVAGEGIFLGAQLAQDARGFARAKLAAALEHHVFECV